MKSLSITFARLFEQRRAAVCLVTLTLALTFSDPLFSHGGEDHAEAEPTLALVGNSRSALQGEYAEAVATADDTGISFWLDETDSNAPLTATLQLQLDGEEVVLQNQSEGRYRATLAKPLSPGNHSLVLTLITDTNAELLTGELVIADHDSSATHSFWSATWALLILPLAGAAWWFYQRQHLLITAFATLSLLPLLHTSPVLAGGDESDGHRHAEQTTAADSGTLGEASKRLPDGSLFVPKSAQHLLNVRTEKVSIREQAMTLRLNGQVIADPNGSGLIQAPQAGRVLPFQQRLPALGSKVRAGDTVALLEPVLSQSERAALTGELARVDAARAAAEKRLQRLSGIRDSVPGRDYEQAEVDAAGLRAQQQGLQEALHGKLPLKAPISGVVSDIKLIAGSQVEAGATIVEIVSSDALIVEAAAYDDRYLQTVQSAVFIHNEHQFSLRFLGAGRKLRDQAIPVQFQVIFDASKTGSREMAKSLAIGSIGTVLVESQEQHRGASVPRSALLRGDDGRTQLLIKIAPEQFRLVSIRSELLPDNRALVSDGLNEGDRVVVSGASLLQQIR